MKLGSWLARPLLRSFWRRQQHEIARRWHRSVPLGDQVVDRWERAAAYHFGTGTSVYDSCLVLGDVQVGPHCWIGPFTVLDGSGGLRIGARTTISAGAQVYTHDSLGRTLSGGDADIERSATTIGDDCYIGPNAVVAMGVTIGDGAVVGANSLILSDVPAGARSFGNPGRIQT